jgi:hypothetical protein
MALQVVLVLGLGLPESLLRIDFRQTGPGQRPETSTSAIVLIPVSFWRSSV